MHPARFRPLERNEVHVGLPRLYHLKNETRPTGASGAVQLFVFKTTPASADNYMSMDILTAENVNYYIDLPNE
ncbi:MAG: hypothetical protein ACLUEV_04280 [Alistipes sp.]